MGSTSTITVNTNLSSLICQKYLRDATAGMNTAMERLSTGFKINSGKDDAAGYSVVEGMQAKVNGFDIIETNASMGLDMLTTQEGVLDILNEYLQRVRDLTMQAANGTYGSASLNAIRTEVVQRMEEINRLDARRLELRTRLEEKYPEQMARKHKLKRIYTFALHFL